MLLVPDRHQRRLKPAAHGTQPVDAGVAGGAQGNQKPALVNARATMMNGELMGRATGAAAAAVAIENGVAVSGKAPPGMGLAGVATPAESGSPEPSFAADTEEPSLAAQPKRCAGGRRRRARRRSRIHGEICDAVQSTA